MGAAMMWPVFCLHSVLVAMCSAMNDEMIVYPKMLESRSESGQKVLKISDDITLNLEKSTIFSEEFFVHSTLDDTPIAYHMLGKEAEKNLYHDLKHMASVDVSDDGGLRVEGTLGHTLRIKPLPEERSVDGVLAHMLYHAEEPRLSSAGPTDYVIPDINTSLVYMESRDLKPTKGKHTRRIPAIIFPEVHVVFDYILSKALKFSVKIVSRYIAIMANSANLRYLSLHQPRVQLRIVGITVTRHKKDEPYMVPVQGYEDTTNILDMKTMAEFNTYVEKESFYGGADIVFLLTGRNLSSWENGVLESWQGGRAYMGGVCTRWRVGVSEERVGSFYGVYVFGHELAHSLGCDHDEWGPQNWPPGVIGSKDCPWEDGYMMSYTFKKPNVFSFSSCCQREILNLVNRPEYRCLIEVNVKKPRLHSSRLPGQVSSRQTFCRKIYGDRKEVEADRAYVKTSSCMVRCIIDRHYNSRIHTAVDGVKCAHEKYCALGQCLTKEQISKME
ncbi:venom metalloproteinase BumaMPs1-like [Haemaphysalis longicornis]